MSTEIIEKIFYGDLDYFTRVVIHESGHFVTDVIYSHRLGLHSGVTMIAIGSSEYPGQPGIVIGSNIIVPDQIREGLNSANRSHVKHVIESTAYKVRSLLAGYAAEFVYYKSKHPRLKITELTQVIFDPKEGSGDVSKALQCINALSGGPVDLNLFQLHEQYSDQLLKHLKASINDSTQLFAGITHVTKILIDKFTLQSDELEMTKLQVIDICSQSRIRKPFSTKSGNF